jgi:hypothetical protein
VPVFVGSGVRLFDRIGPARMECTRAEPGNGVMHLQFRFRDA